MTDNDVILLTCAAALLALMFGTLAYLLHKGK